MFHRIYLMANIKSMRELSEDLKRLKIKNKFVYSDSLDCYVLTVSRADVEDAIDIIKDKHSEIDIINVVRVR